MVWQCQYNWCIVCKFWFLKGCRTKSAGENSKRSQKLNGVVDSAVYYIRLKTIQISLGF